MLGGGIIMALIAFLIFNVGTIGLFRSDFTDNVSFHAVSLQGIVPFVVKFKMDLSALDDKPIYLKAGDGMEKRPVSRTDTFFSRMFFAPGKKEVQLIYGEEVIKKIDLIAETNGWLGLVDKHYEGSHPVYLTKEAIINGDVLYVSPKYLEERQVDIGANYKVNFYYVNQELACNGNNFDFRAAVRHSIKKGARTCQQVNLGLLATDGFVVIPLLNEGCVSLAKIFFSEVFIDGWTNDLDAFSRDLDKWQMVKVKNRNQFVRIYINEQEAFSFSYNKPLGEIIGFRIEFMGCGEIDFVELVDAGDHSVVYNNDFGSKRSY